MICMMSSIAVRADRVELVVGLEIHVQLSTVTKMFSSCPTGFGEPPNALVDEVTLGLPGVLPVLNHRAIEYTLRLGLAFGCEIAGLSKWDRKSYYYPDLPKNYQISQYDLPLVGPGEISYRRADGSIGKVRLRRAHLEEDAGKNIHDFPGFTGVDLNRAGMALLEIVTEPDLGSAEDAGALARELQRTVRGLGVSEGVMQRGHMRFEPNINLRIEWEGKTFKTPIVEVKNLNSFKALEGAIAYERVRQLAEWEADPWGFSLEKLGKQNRGWDDGAGETLFQRSKEDAHDYRYFPEPDLPPVRIGAEWLAEIRAGLPELPLVREERYIRAFGLSAVDAAQIADDAETAVFFDSCIAAAGEGPVRGIVAKQFVNVWSRLANEQGCGVGALPGVQPGLAADRIAELAVMVDGGAVSATAAGQIAEAMLKTGRGPRELAGELGLEQVQDTGATQAWVDQAIAANPKAVSDAKENAKKKQAALGFLRGQVMKLSGGKANPKLVGELLEQALGGS